MKNYIKPHAIAITLETSDVMTMSSSDLGSALMGLWSDFKTGTVEE